MTILDTRPLFRPLHDQLVLLLRGLERSDWQRSTVAGGWRVHDVVAHLLDGELRALSALRDGHAAAPDVPIDGFASLVGWLDRLNAEWVAAARRLSPGVMIELLEAAGPQVTEILADQLLDVPAPFPVDWAAGEARSQNWLHIGREYTERWHHQMQIRDAVGAPGLLEAFWLEPLLDLSVLALPRAYEDTVAEIGTRVVLEVADLSAWEMVRESQSWKLDKLAPDAPDSAVRVRLEADDAWRLFYNALTPAEARRRADIEGDENLATPLFRARSVMVRAPQVE